MSNRDRSPRGPRSSKTSKQDPPVDLLEVGPESDLLEFEGSSRLQATIKVLGVGGGGGNALNTMIESGLGGVEFIAANTDAQALEVNRATIKLQLGPEATRGLGCGANPEMGKTAALEARDRIAELLEGTDMVFVTAGLGGGTGTGAAPIVAEVARELGALTVAVVTKPFQFEGRVRTKQAERGLDELNRVVDTLITIPNNRLLALAGKKAVVKDAFRLADDVLLNAVKGISDLITVHGIVNLDFADVHTIMNEMGMALMGTGIGHGETRAADAARAAISSPLLEDLSIEGARGVLINITGGAEMTLYEVNEASTLVQEAAHEEANIIFGAVIDENLKGDEVRVTVIATGLDDGCARRGRDAPLNDLDNVTPLRRDPLPSRDGITAMEAGSGSAGSEEYPERGWEQPSSVAERSDDFVSPFEDELDVPAFLRRNSASEDEEERELPAFLRRSAD